ncbi:integrase catalytic domain-containing protein [Trichonephila clavipes]|nr:integrase catalytic domain-containing protein [Trichonephila clavipes]
MAWERKRNTETDAKGSPTLEYLMTFLRLEVQGEEMVQLAKSGFGTPIRKRDSPTERVKPTELMTASALASSVKSSDQERKVGVLIDTACENSYISESVTSILKATPLREETIIHSLFGGNETKPKHLSVYSIEVSDLKHSYACCFEVLSEKKICGFISKIEDKRILNELKNKEIILSDLNCKETEIGLLIGADNIGKLLTGNLIEFDSGLTAIETKLGWTVIGKVCSNDKNVMLTTSSLHVRNVSVKELWELDVLGRTYPLLNENTKENFELTDFKNKMKILPDGRYEVKLPKLLLQEIWKMKKAWDQELPQNIGVFIARRGRPRIIYCDNGTNFRGAFNDLAKLDWHKISRETSTQKIVWKFIPPTAAWWGGWWERLVRIIKELLRRSLGKSILSYEELSTVICGCEFLINSRPLTYISENPQELIPLTPAMFLIENRCSDTTDIDELNSRDLRKRE